jgi:hypothetical protein
MLNKRTQFKPGAVRFLFALFLFVTDSCKVSQVFLRDNQEANKEKNDDIVRLYLDKFGALYPAIEVPIDRKDFEDTQLLKRQLKDVNSFNLEFYFTSNAKRMEKLRNAYQVPAGGTAPDDFHAVQAQIIAGYVKNISMLAAKQQAGMVIFLVHGFNEPHPELPDKYPFLRETINSDPKAAALKPIYVELYWDGLDAFGYHPLPVARIWPPSRYNSRWVALSLRNFIYQMEKQVHLPIAIVTHSLGASVATAALFNNNSNWAPFKIDPAMQQRFNQLMETPTPVTEIRLGMLAPAIPGTATFENFNKRSPVDIQPGQNNIKRAIIAYDPFDYAVSKDLFRLISLAPLDGPTTLGCNYYSPKTRYTEIESVFSAMRNLGYATTDLQQLIRPIRFNTGLRPASGGNDEHAMEYYVRDTLHAKLFFGELFR